MAGLRVAGISTQCMLLIGLFRIVSGVCDFGSRSDVTFPIQVNVLSSTQLKRDMRIASASRTHVCETRFSQALMCNGHLFEKKSYLIKYIV